MNGNSGFRVLAAVLLAIVLAAIVAIGAYDAGVEQGMMTGGKVVVAPWHHGFSPVFPIFALVAVVALFAVMRAALWRGHWHHHHHQACCAPVRQDENDSHRG